MAKEVYGEGETTGASLFGLGKEIQDREHFNGKVYMKEILGFEYSRLADTVTFAPGVRNHWHIHQVGQILFVTDGTGWYQEEGKQAQFLQSVDVIRIPAGVKHWHRASQYASCTGRLVKGTAGMAGRSK